MNDIDQIKHDIEHFLGTHGAEQTQSPEDAFTPYFLHKHFSLAPQEAFRSSSDGKDDAGIDGFYLEKAEPPILWLVQAKLSSLEQSASKGIEDLARALPIVEKILRDGETDLADENRVLKNLRSAIGRLDPAARASLRMKCVLLHLLPNAELWRTRARTETLLRDFNTKALDCGFGGRADIDFFGPKRLKFGEREVVPQRPEPAMLGFSGTEVALADGSSCWFGLAALDDLVSLYDLYGVNLFAKNVRMFLHREAKKERSASSHIKETLGAICFKGALPPDHFCVMHNGVVLQASGVVSNDGHLSLDPGHIGVSVLNGCQSIYTAWRFREDVLKRKDAKDLVCRERWMAVRVPVRVVATHSDDLVRKITVSTNRQTELESSAFWAHHPIQLEIGRRLKKLGVFYERQDGAWEQISRSEQPSDRERRERFMNGKIWIEDLGRAIAGAQRAVPLAHSARPHLIFDSEGAYARVFAPRHLKSVRLLVLLDNLLRATKVALRLLTEDVGYLDTLKAGSFMFPAFRLLAQYLVKAKEWDRLRDLGSSVLPATRGSDHCRWVTRQLGSGRSGIQQVLRDVWWDAEEDDWADPLETGRLDVAFAKLRLANVDIFGDYEWAGYDDEEGASDNPEQ